MSTVERSPLRDAELVALLQDEPELLAIADALVETVARRRRLPRRGAAWIAAAATVAAAAALLLVSPWQGRTGIVDRALAAVGDGEVLHLVIDWRERSGSERLVDIESGRTVARERRSEIWFDGGRDLKKTFTTLDGRTVEETLETAEGGWTQSGPIYTCSWIAAHPIAATKARVSCNENMDNGTTPRKIPEKPPTLDDALAGFVDGYRSALASGRARNVGTGEVDGRAVVWLRIALPANSSPMTPASEDVAIDADTSKPVEVRYESGEVAFRVALAETLPYDAAVFAKPELAETQGGGNIGPGTPVSFEQAARILGHQPFWLGESWNGSRLVAVEHHRPKLTFFLDGRKRVEESDAISLTYEPMDGGSRLEIFEAPRCIFNTGMTCGPDAPEEGQVLVRIPVPTSLRIGGLWVSVWGGSKSVPGQLELARALHPYAG